MRQSSESSHRECLGVINNNTPHLSAPQGLSGFIRRRNELPHVCSLTCLPRGITEKLTINRNNWEMIICVWCVPGCEQEQDLLWEPDMVTGVENQYWAGISLSRHQPFIRVQGWMSRVIILTSPGGETTLLLSEQYIDTIKSGMSWPGYYGSRCGTNVILMSTLYIANVQSRGLQVIVIICSWVWWSVLSVGAVINFNTRAE